MKPEEIQPDLNASGAADVQAALKALGEADRALDAPPEMEARLRAAFRSRAFVRQATRSPAPLRVWRWIPAAAAAAILAIMVSHRRPPVEHTAVVKQGQSEQEMEIRKQLKLVRPGETAFIPPNGPRMDSKAPAQLDVDAKGNAEMTRAARSAHGSASAKSRAARARDSQPQEIATDFFPLVEFPPPMDNGELVRVSLPASAMREVGLPVREDRLEDRVQADVLMSNGLATAIRFVKYTQK